MKKLNLKVKTLSMKLTHANRAIEKLTAVVTDTRDQNSIKFLSTIPISQLSEINKKNGSEQISRKSKIAVLKE